MLQSCWGKRRGNSLSKGGGRDSPLLDELLATRAAGVFKALNKNRSSSVQLFILSCLCSTSIHSCDSRPVRGYADSIGAPGACELARTGGGRVDGVCAK